jgi:hypothetical protein
MHQYLKYTPQTPYEKKNASCVVEATLADTRELYVRVVTISFGVAKASSLRPLGIKHLEK